MADSFHVEVPKEVDFELGVQIAPSSSPKVSHSWATRFLLTLGLLGAFSLILLFSFGPDNISLQPPRGMGVPADRMLVADDGYAAKGPNTASIVGVRIFFQLSIVLLVCVCQFAAYERSKGKSHEVDEGLLMDLSNADIYHESLTLKQLWAAIEFCSIEAKNRYMSEDGGVYIDERSDCCQRICASVNRELTLFVHTGPNKMAPVALRLYKPYHLQGCCCCCRPQMRIDLPDGTAVGSIKDPFKCCVMDQQIFDDQEKLRFQVTGHVCQCGTCCPCCADIEFDIQDGFGNNVGLITKRALTCSELCTKTNRFTVDFPRQCTMDDKHLLVGSAMLLDLQYFEQNKSDN